MKTKNKGNQIILFLGIIIILFVAISIIEKSQIPDPKLKEDAEKLLNAISTNSLKLLDSNELNEKSFEEISKKEYVNLKNGLGLKSDFCIHFEDINGNVIKINGKDARVGSERVKVNGISCG